MAASLFDGKVFADSTPWRDVIALVEQKSATYNEFARSRGDFGAATALNGIDANKHRCAIIGRMLGFVSEIKEAEYLEEPPLTTEVEAYAQLEYAYSLDSWVASARFSLEMSPSKRATVWNLECVGKYGIPKDAFFGSGETRGEFEVEDDGTLMVYGDIEAGFYEKFVEVLNSNPQISSVWLGSGGGSVKDAVLSGLEVRKRKLTTQLFSTCFSACPLIFAAGTERIIYPNQGDLSVTLGFHKVSVGGEAIPPDSTAYRELSNYLTSMGADGPKVISWMQMAEPQEMYTPESSEVCEVGLATFVYHVCSL